MPDKKDSHARKPRRTAGEKNRDSDVIYPRAPLFWDDVVKCYEERQLKLGKPDPKFQAKDLKHADDTLIVGSDHWSRIRSGKRPVGDERAHLKSFFGDCLDLDKFAEVYRHTRVPDLLSWNPVVGLLDWPPFCSSEPAAGFLVDVVDRFFRLSRLENCTYKEKQFADLLSGADVDLSLALAETIIRSKMATTFHTPGLMGVNLLGRYEPEYFTMARDVLMGTRVPDKAMPLRVAYVKDEVGGEFVESLPKIPNFELHGQDPRSENKMAEIESLLQKKNELWLCCADELTCIHKLSSDRGLLFPITTPQVVREKVYSRLPSYRIGLFTVPEYQDVVLTFLKKALRVYLENSVVETALRYQDLYLRLLKDVTQSLETMNADAAAYLLDAHNQCGDTFYAGVDRIPILAERWSRYVLRLYPEQAAHDLNLPWGQILDRTRELIGPVSIQVRTPTERRAALMYRELPPVIAAEPHSCDDFSIFGAVLGTLSPHVDLLSAKRYQRSEPSSHMGSDNPATVAVGFFAVPPRLFDWRFHRFPIKFRFAGAFISNAEGKQRQRQIQECLELLKVLETGNHQVKPPDDVRVLLLTFGATHNLLRDHGVEGPLFRTVDDTKTPRGEAFLNVVDDCNERDQAAIVIADELTCLEVIGASTKPRRMELLNHRLGGVFADDVDPGAGAYFSVAVRSSASEWVRFFEQSIPLSLESYRESIARSHVRLHGSLKKWTSRQVKSLGPDAPSEGAIEKWCRDVLLLDEPESLTREWTPVLKRAAELLAKSYTAQQ